MIRFGDLSEYMEKTPDTFFSLFLAYSVIFLAILMMTLFLNFKLKKLYKDIKNLASESKSTSINNPKNNTLP